MAVIQGGGVECQAMQRFSRLPLQIRPLAHDNLLPDNPTCQPLQPRNWQTASTHLVSSLKVMLEGIFRLFCMLQSDAGVAGQVGPKTIPHSCKLRTTDNILQPFTVDPRHPPFPPEGAL